MSIFTKLGADIAAPTDAAGAPRKVVNGEFQTWMTEVERLIQIATGNGDLLLFNSKDDLDSSLNHPANTGALLIGESIADDGLYMKQGASGAGSWVKIGGVPGQGFVKATNTGTGTSTAIEASTPVAVNETQLILLPIAAENAGSPVTVSFNGGSPLTIKTVSGSDVAAGGLPASSVMLGTIHGSTFRLLSDQASAAIQAAAEAAADRAEAAAASISEIATNFASVALLIADETLSYSAGSGAVEVIAGDIVYAGGYRYKVAASGATDEHVTTAGGVKLYVVPVGGVFHIEAWGDPVTEESFQKAVNDIAVIAAIPSGRWPRYRMVLSSEVDIANGVVVERPGAPLIGCDVDFWLGALRAVSGGSLTPTTPILKIRARDCIVRCPDIDCLSLASGIEFYDSFDSVIYPQHVRHFGTTSIEGFGYRFAGEMDNATVYGGWGYQWDLSDPEFDDRGNFTGVLWDIDAYDFRIEGIRGGWCKVPIRISQVAAHVFFNDIHPFNGAPNHTPAVDPVLIENHGLRYIYIFDSYLDNGLILDYRGSLHIKNSKVLEHTPSVTLSSPIMRVYCPDDKNGQAPANILENNEKLSVGYFQGPGGANWAANFSQQSDWYDEQEADGVSSSSLQRRVNIYNRGDGVPIEQNFRPGGAFRHDFQSGTSPIKTVLVDPETNVYNTGHGILKAGGWQLTGNSGTLVINSGSITPTGHFHLIDTEGSAASDDLTTISTSGILDGALLTICTIDNTRDVVVKHNVGNIFCGSDRTLSNTADTITLVKFGVYWRMVSFADNI